MADNGDFDAGLCNICTFHHERLREQYAGMAMQALMIGSKDTATYAVKYADALIAQLTKDGE
jgi:hypothetical protein